MNKTFYITTPIYYVNGVPHVGSATTTLICDAVARYHRAKGEPVFFLTGTDEHAQKVAEAAEKAGKPTQEFVDDISQRFVAEWALLGIQYDQFIRTSEPVHKSVVAEVFTRLQAAGDVYKGKYEGWYSVSDETYYRDSDVADGRAKDTGSVVERVTEENYYFRLSSYSDRLLSYIDSHPDFLEPETRKNEVIAFIKDGLRDVPISRRNAGWGITAPGDPSQVVYVWFDALVNYLTATGWPATRDGAPLWPAQAHIVGKEIYTRFHATLWPAMLMGLGLPLPEHVIGHGWWLVRAGDELRKMSKSAGKMPTTEDVTDWLIETSGIQPQFAIDALRFYLLRDIAFTGDSEFSYENLTMRYNGDLANNLGNALNRSINMLQKYNQGTVPDRGAQTAGSDFAEAARAAFDTVSSALDDYNPGTALEAISRFSTAINKAIDTAAPWKRFAEGDQPAIDLALYGALEALRVLSILISPFTPQTGAEIRRQLGLAEAPVQWADAQSWGLLPGGTQVNEAVPIYPRIEKKKTQPQSPAPKQPAQSSSQTEAATPATPGGASKESTKDTIPMITIEDFAKVELRIAEIKTAERVEGAKKLLRLTVDAGDAEPRQLVAGVAESYAPEDLPGRKIVIVANLAPATIRGVESNGMLLAATDADGKAILLTPENKDTPAGSKIK